MFRKGDIVTRKKYSNDLLFKVDRVEGNKVFLKGIDVRLYADALINDLVIYKEDKKKEEVPRIKEIDTNNFFFFPGIILHLDSDSDYMQRCMQYYEEQNIKAYSYLSDENMYSDKIIELVKKYRPSIIVITGHDAYYKNKKDNKFYKNSDNFINTVIEIRKKYKDITIFAGACQSNYEELIKSGATYASSPNRVNIHALDPAIIASYVALTDINETIDIKEVLSKTFYKEKGIGGIIVKGKMVSGYPRGGKY